MGIGRNRVEDNVENRKAGSSNEAGLSRNTIPQGIAAAKIGHGCAPAKFHVADYFVGPRPTYEFIGTEGANSAWFMVSHLMVLELLNRSIRGFKLRATVAASLREAQGRRATK